MGRTSVNSVFIANRGEIAVRIVRACADLGVRSVVAFVDDEATALPTRLADESVRLSWGGARAFLDVEGLISSAQQAGCDAVHPGYGFLSESAEFAEACAVAGLRFIGPSPDALRLFGNKAAARALAARLEVPLLPGTNEATTLAEAEVFFRELGEGAAIMLKPLLGGGGRGMRVVTSLDDLAESYAICSAEAEGAFGHSALYVEQFVTHARHVEVQIIGDANGDIVVLGERECSLQRQRQKVVEIAPCASLTGKTRRALYRAALKLGSAQPYSGLCTFEFLLDTERGDRFSFMEANPRIQVEHTITEQVTGLDLVQAQIKIARGASLGDLGLSSNTPPVSKGRAIQLRVTSERLDEAGNVRPSAGCLKVYETPSGPGVRVDSAGYAGYTANPSFDTLFAKLIFTVKPGADHLALINKAERGLRECRFEGVATNLAFLRALLGNPDVRNDRIDTQFIERNLEHLCVATLALEAEPSPLPSINPNQVRENDVSLPPGCDAIISPLSGAVSSLLVGVDETIVPGQTIALISAMKMEHVVAAPKGGVVKQVFAQSGAIVSDGDPIIAIEYSDIGAEGDLVAEAASFDDIPEALSEVRERHALLLDDRRPDAVARRRKTGQRTVRENIDHLCDPGTFIEYGSLTLAAQRRRRTMDELIAMSPADGLVCGTARINGDLYPAESSLCLVMGYDYTVFAGTQGIFNHKKMDRMFDVATRRRLPMVLFAEGGGGRPGDTDALMIAGLETSTFARASRLSGKVPLVGIASGRCFAGNAALLGCCDVIIATKNANIGMGGPAMIEGGGLGAFRPEDIGPAAIQSQNGVIDIVVEDEAEAVGVAKKYLSYFQGDTVGWGCDDQRALRHAVPANRLRVYDVRKVLELLSDKDSVLELRKDFGKGMITALVRIEGRPIGVIANNCQYLSGAIDSEASDKSARFQRLCDAFGLPIISLCDTPGFMVGPETEKTAAVRHMARLFMIGANVEVPRVTVVLRKAYGLGAMAMAGGGFHEPVLTVAWPSGEFGGMGLEGAVRLGFRSDLEAVEDPVARAALFEKLVAELYERGKAISIATVFEIDDVIDPAETRSIILRSLEEYRPVVSRQSKFYIDPW